MSISESQFALSAMDPWSSSIVGYFWLTVRVRVLFITVQHNCILNSSLSDHRFWLVVTFLVLIIKSKLLQEVPHSLIIPHFINVSLFHKAILAVSSTCQHFSPLPRLASFQNQRVCIPKLTCQMLPRLCGISSCKVIVTSRAGLLSQIQYWYIMQEVNNSSPKTMLLNGAK